MVLIAENGGTTTPEEYQEIISVIPVIQDDSDFGLAFNYIYMVNGAKVINVLDVEYDITHLTKEQVLLMITLRGMYVNHSTMRYDKTFEVFVYEQTLDNIIIKLLVPMLEPDDNDDDDSFLEPYMPSEFEKWLIRLKKKL